MQSIDQDRGYTSLFAGYVFPEQAKRKGSERGELIDFFSKVLNRTPKYTGIRLAHYSIDHLYALKSAFLERKTRNGALPATKYLWWITKVINT